MRGRRRPLFVALAGLPGILLATAIPWACAQAEPSGAAAAVTAWQASFLERGLPIPTSTRRGWWIEQRTPHVPDPLLGWRLARNDDPEFPVDGAGVQRVRGWSWGSEPAEVLVTGGSVAVGLGASSREACWSTILARRLGQPIDVAAACAWKAEQEALAIWRHRTGHTRLVVMLTGLNDATVGLDAHARFNGTNRPWDPEARARTFMARVALARALAHPAPLLVVLQPFREAKRPLTEIETHLGIGHEERIQRYLRAVRSAIRRGPWLDLSAAFSGAPTTMIDEWHFSDPGHALLAQRLWLGITAFRRGSDRQSPRASR